MPVLLLTNNRVGVLSRIISVVSSLSANIETAAVYPLGPSGISVVHLTPDAGEVTRDRLQGWLPRLIDVGDITLGSDAKIWTRHLGLTSAAAAGQNGSCP